MRNYGSPKEKERQRRLDEKRSRPVTVTVYSGHPDLGIIEIGCQSVTEKTAIVHPSHSKAVGGGTNLPRHGSSMFSKLLGFDTTPEAAAARLRAHYECVRKNLAEELTKLQNQIAKNEQRIAHYHDGVPFRRIPGDSDIFPAFGDDLRKGPFEGHTEDAFAEEQESLEPDDE